MVAAGAAFLRRHKFPPGLLQIEWVKNSPEHGKEALNKEFFSVSKSGMIFSQRLTDTAYFPGFRLRSTEEGDTWVWGELEPHGLSSPAEQGRLAPRKHPCPKILTYMLPES